MVSFIHPKEIAGRTFLPNRTVIMLAWFLALVAVTLALLVNPLAGLGVGVVLLSLLSAALASWFNKAVFILVFFELALGGTGHIVDFWRVIPLREAVFILVFAFFFCAWIADSRARTFSFRGCPACLSGAILGVGTFLFFGVFVGHLRGNPLQFIVADSQGFLCLGIAVPLYYFAIRGKKVAPGFLAACFLLATSIFGALKGIAYILPMLGVADLNYLIDWVRYATSQDVIASAAGILPRIFILGDLLFSFSLPLAVSISLLAAKTRQKFYAQLAVACIATGLLSSGSRGLWMGALLGIAVVLWFSGLKKKLTFAFMLMIVIGSLALLSPSFVSSVHQRLAMAFDWYEPSNYIRFGQFWPLMDKAYDHIIIGNGYGATVPDLVRSITNPFSYELQPVAFLMKMGIVGCALWSIFLIWLVRHLYRTAKGAKDPLNRAIAFGVLGGLSAYLAGCGTNPYFVSSTGMGAFTFALLMTDIIRNRVVADLESREHDHTSRGSREQRLPSPPGRGRARESVAL